MEELLFALVVWIGKQIAKAYRAVQGWVQGRRDARAAARERRPGTGVGSATVASTRGPLAPPDPYRAEREGLEARAARLAEDSETRGRDLASTPATAALGQLLHRDVAGWAREVGQAVRRLPPGPVGALDLERHGERLGALERFGRTVTWGADQRRRDGDRALQAADRVAAALYAPLAAVASGREARAAEPPQPVALRGERARLDLALFARTGVAPVLVPEAFPADPFHWAALAHEVGCDVLERTPGLGWELRSRLGLPDRYPVPFAFRGYWGQEELLGPWGAWLEVGFGDLVGTLSLGPAYAVSLLGRLARPDRPEAVASVSTTREGAFYSPEPPAHLRMVFVLHALEALGHPGPAERLAKAWRELHDGPWSIYVPSRLQGWLEAPLGPFEHVARRLAAVILEEPFSALGGDSLARVEGLTFGEWEQSRAEALAERLLTAGDATESDLRLRLAAALLARERSASGAGRLGRWLLEGALPVVRAEVPAPGAAPAPARGREDPATLWRDAVVLGALLERRPFGAAQPQSWR